MMGIGLTELIVILALVLVVFGAGKLSGVGKALGKSVKEFKEEVHDESDKKEVVSEDKEEI